MEWSSRECQKEQRWLPWPAADDRLSRYDSSHQLFCDSNYVRERVIETDFFWCGGRREFESRVLGAFKALNLTEKGKSTHSFLAYCMTLSYLHREPESSAMGFRCTPYRKSQHGETEIGIIPECWDMDTGGISEMVCFRWFICLLDSRYE